MAEFKKIDLSIKHTFDERKKRHFFNGVQTVYHCHHYTALYTQLALDAGEEYLLTEVAEQNFFKILNDYFSNNNITELADRISIACQYYSAIGLGVIELQYVGDDSGIFVSKKSHVEHGWIKKWGKYDKPVNYIGCGYISAIFSSIFNLPVGSYSTFELESIVKGDEKTVFKTYKK